MDQNPHKEFGGGLVLMWAGKEADDVVSETSEEGPKFESHSHEIVRVVFEQGDHISSFLMRTPAIKRVLLVEPDKLTRSEFKKFARVMLTNAFDPVHKYLNLCWVRMFELNWGGWVILIPPLPERLFWLARRFTALCLLLGKVLYPYVSETPRGGTES